MRFGRKWLADHKKEIALSLFSFVFFAIVLILVGLFVQWPSDTRWQVPSTQFDSQLGWSTIPSHSATNSDGSFVSFNSLGFRSPEFDASDPVILVVGDSVAFGTGVSNGETMADFLSQSTIPIPVANAGVPGYGVDQYYLRLKQDIQHIHPTHIFVILFPGNDRLNTIQNVQYGKSKPLFVPVNGSIELQGVPILKNSCINQFSTSVLMKVARAIPFSSVYDTLENWGNNYCGVKVLNDADAKIVVSSLLTEIKELGESHGARVHFVISPTESEVTQSSEEIAFFKSLLVQENIPFMDLTPFLSAQPNVHELYFDGAHYSVKGNELVAGQLSLLLTNDLP